MANKFDPFSKPFDSILCDDLAILREVKESWYVEYKSEMVSARDLAKSISAFANQHGGWLFIGIAESANETAEAFAGIENPRRASAILRAAVSDHVSPEVYFESKLIEGPCEKIDLPAGKCIMVISVPSGTRSPYIHSSGRIFRRVGDSSVPVPETDRSVLDHLYERSRASDKRLRDHITRMATDAFGGQAPAIRLFMISNATLEPLRKRLEFESFRDACAPQGGGQPALPLDQMYTTTSGFVGRHVFQNDPKNLLVSFRWDVAGNSCATIPLNIESGSVKGLLGHHKFADSFYSMLSKSEYRKLPICDITHVPSVLALLHSLNNKLLGLVAHQVTPSYAFQIDGTAGHIPFIDDEQYIRSVKELGFPISADNAVSIPVKLSDHSLIKALDLSEFSMSEEEKSGLTNFDESLIQLTPVLLLVLRSVGLWRFDDIMSLKSIFGFPHYIKEMARQ